MSRLQRNRHDVILLGLVIIVFGLPLFILPAYQTLFGLPFEGRGEGVLYLLKFVIASPLLGVLYLLAVLALIIDILLLRRSRKRPISQSKAG